MNVEQISIDELLEMARAGHDLQGNKGLTVLVRQLHNEAEPALRELLTVNPLFWWRVRELQNRVNQYLILREKVATTIEVGRSAENTILDRESDEQS